MFWCQKTNSAFPNLFPSDVKLPARTKSLLGLGFKFCIKRRQPYQDLCTALKQFKLLTDNQDWLVKSGVEPNKYLFNWRLWVSLGEVPNPVDKELVRAFDRFKCLVNKLRNNLPTYRRFNLKPLLCKAMSALCTMLQGTQSLCCLLAKLHESRN